MNKTIIININGIVFHIEEDAYEILKNYMTDVKRHFLNSADSLEITTDIENRIAEMLSEILVKENKQVIVEQDVNLVIEQMGTVEDFEHAEEGHAAEAPYNYNTGNRTLFRDPDDHLLGGVCAGLANYFDIQAVWVRLAFALAVAFGGTGLILYIILWIVIPKAVTRADRMAMKGEKFNLQGFKNNFEEELSAVRHNLNNLHREAQPVIYKIRDFLDDLFFHTGRFFKSTGSVLVKLFGIFILIDCFLAAIALVICLALVIVWGTGPIHMFPFSVIENQYANTIYISGFLVAIIPIIAIALLTINGVFNKRTIGKSSGSVILVIWLFAIGTLIFYASKVSAGFRSSASFNETIALKPTTNNTYYLKLNDIKYFTSEDSARLDIKSRFKNMVVTNDGDFKDIENIEPENISIKIEKSDVSSPVLVQSFHSKGSRYEDALLNARNTRYIFIQQDSILKFDRKLQRLPGVSWHDQEIELTLKVPLNATLVIDEDLDRYLRNGIDVNECKQINKKPDATSSIFIMTTNGLECKVDTLVIPATIPTDTVKILNTKPVKVKR